MEWLELIEGTIGHLAWPVAIFLILNQFRAELGSAINRIKSVRYKDAEINLEQEMMEIKNDAEMAGITIAYPPGSFAQDSVRSIELAPEWVFIKSWQEIENVIMGLRSKLPEDKKYKGPITLVVQRLVEEGIIDPTMASLIDKLRSVRNRVVHEDSDVTRGEALEWLGISRSVKDRLAQKLA
ncbi:DUF4145 domain-containing protein [Vreelandella titanicae]|jgi:hypothetical protein|uniref:DUF4145 domain-containing protein n=1 Tax=Vreelandella titanicae TaxID=664683 RepID=UPI00241DD570|nr:DUF4145 domain-containing protein [Halomonas titanicae]